MLASVLAMLWVAAQARPAAAQACPDGNLLEGRAHVVARGSGTELGRLTDRAMVPDGTPFNTSRAVVFQAGSTVVWDLGRPTRVRSVVVQGDNNDAFVVSGSLDGQTFEGFWTAPPVEPLGLRLRASANVDVTVRFLRVDPVPADGITSLTEVQAFCAAEPPAIRPWTIRSPYTPDPGALRYRTGMAAKAALLLAAIALLAWLRRAGPKVAAATFAVALVVCAAAWTEWGVFHGGLRVHPSDTFHYFFGPKYFRETGYFDFYTCIAQAERENGRGATIDAGFVRDLHDNSLHPGAWTATPEGRCHGRFSERRWAAFRRDIELYLPHFPQALPLIRMLADHGYNGTPITSTFHRLVIGEGAATRGRILGLTYLDVVSNLLAVLLMAWGFGVRGGILTALVIACGEPWGYQWVGGTIGRATWVVALAAGLALAARGRRTGAAIALSISTLFRLFPAVFLGALGLGAVVRTVRARAVGREDKRLFAATAGTLAVGIVVAGLSVGFDAYPAWVKVIVRHSATPAANHLGLARFADFQPDSDSSVLADNQLTDPLETFSTRSAELHRERRPLHVLAIAAAFGLLVYAAARGARDEELVALGGPLLFSLMAITNYDGVWTFALVPLVLGRDRRVAAFLTTIAGLQLLALWFGNIEHRCTAQSTLLLMLLLYLAVDFVRELEARVTPAAT